MTYLYQVEVTRYISPENGLTESVEYVKAYKTERGAILHILDVFKGKQKGTQYNKELPNGDLLVAKIVPVFSK